MPDILIVEDEPSIADNITYALSTEGYNAHWRASGRDGLAVLEAGGIDLVILDVGLPDINGFDLAKEIRKRFEVPLIFVTARNSEIDRVVGLEIGGDDYVVKPFSPRELTARVRAVLRRTAGRTEPAQPARSLPRCPFVVDEARYAISFQGNPLELSRYEYRLLRVLVLNQGRVYSREQLMEKVWDEPDMSLERTVDTHIKTLRQKLRAFSPRRRMDRHPSRRRLFPERSLMKTRVRIFLTILATVGIGFFLLVYWITKDLKPQFRASTEEPLVDTAWALAALASAQVRNGAVDVTLFREMFAHISPEITPAPIYDFIKTTMDLRVYITNATGKVVFDSTGRDEGMDYSRWNDVVLTLQGKYGTRTSSDAPLGSEVEHHVCGRPD